MGAQFLNQPQGEGLTSDPREQFDFSGLSMLAQSARQASQIARERKMLRDLMRMSGQEVAEPAPEKGIVGGLKRVFGVGEEYQPISEMERLQGQAGIKKMFEPSMAETVELERQKAAAGRRPIEEELSLEEAKAGIKAEAAKKNIASPEGLTSEQQIQARALSKKLYGVRGAQFGLPPIFEEMRKGKNIDEIEDSLRYAGQSKEFSGAIRNAAQSVLINTSEDKSQKSLDYMDDLLSKGDIEGTKNQLKRLARTQAGMEEQRAIVGKERTIKLLDEVQDDLNNLEKMGTNTNIFTGTAEQIAAKVGTVRSPEARKIATKISGAVQNYRRSMTGVQFGMPENLEYQAMFPKIGRTANFNSANIRGLKEIMQGDLDNFYSLSMGEEDYGKIFGKSEQATGEVKIDAMQNIPEGQTATNPKTGQKIIFRGGKWQVTQ